MCTVIFIPENNKKIFASLRDEDPLRPTAINPELVTINDTTILSPKDALAGGTWLGINDHNNVIILLNGAFEKHQRKKSYRKSRGLIVSELLALEMPIVDWELMNLEDIEPFTLIVWSNYMLFQLVWDGITKHRARLDATIPHLFSSSTLYTAESKAKRVLLFENWIAKNPLITELSLLNFFKSYNDNENGFIMNRNEKVKTLSYSYIELKDNRVAELSYYDLNQFAHSTQTILMKTNPNDCIIHD